MQTADSSPSALGIFATSALRAVVVALGGSVAAWWLVDLASTATGSETDIGSYTERLGDALSPTASVSNALGNTMYLAAAALFVAVIVGAIIGGLARLRAVSAVLSCLTPLALAVFVPGFVLLPIAWAATTGGTIVPGPLPEDVAFADSLPFVAMWGGLAGLSLVPGLASRIASGRGIARFGGRVASASVSARTDSDLDWRIGLPTSAFLASLAAAELLSGHRGLFSLFKDSFELGDLITVFEILVLVIVAGAVLAAAVDALGAATNRLGSSTEPGAVRASRSAIAFFALLAVAVVAAGAGYGLDSADEIAAEPMLDPFSSGSWLGTDAVGRSLAVRLAASIGPSLVFSFLVASVAAIAGLVVAIIRHTVPAALDRAFGMLVDLFWWPMVLFFPLISLAFESPARPEIDPRVVLVSGLILMPMASRLFGRTVTTAADSRTLRVLSGWLFLCSTVLSVHLVAAFMAPFGSGEHPNLGQLIAEGFADYQGGNWPFLLASVSAALLAATLYFLAASMAAPTERVAQPAPAVAGGELIESPSGPIDETLQQPQPVPDADLAASGVVYDDGALSPTGPEQPPAAPEVSPLEISAETTDGEAAFEPMIDLTDAGSDPGLSDGWPEHAPDASEESEPVAADESYGDGEREYDASPDDQEMEADVIDLDAGPPALADTQPEPESTIDWTEIGSQSEDVAIAPPTPPTRPTPRRRPILEQAERDAAGDTDFEVEAARTVELRPSTIRIAVAQAEAARVAEEAAAADEADEPESDNMA